MCVCVLCLIDPTDYSCFEFETIADFSLSQITMEYIQGNNWIQNIPNYVTSYWQQYLCEYFCEPYDTSLFAFTMVNVTQNDTSLFVFHFEFAIDILKSPYTNLLHNYMSQLQSLLYSVFTNLGAARPALTLNILGKQESVCYWIPRNVFASFFCFFFSFLFFFCF